MTRPNLYNIQFTNEEEVQLYKGLDALADAADLSTAVYCKAVLEGAKRKGLTDTLVRTALANKPGVKRRPRKRLEWEVVGETPPQGGRHLSRPSNIYGHGEYRLTKSEMTWWLTGPGIVGDGLQCGEQTKNAQVVAEEHIRRLSRKPAA